MILIMSIISMRTGMVAAWAMVATACTTPCYNDRFCQELIGQQEEAVVALIGEPTHVAKQGRVKILEWAFDGTYRASRVVPGFSGMWVDAFGHFHPMYAAPYMVIETVPQVATLRFSFVRGRATSYNAYFNGSGMCNYFVPPQYIERYRAEDRTR